MADNNGGPIRTIMSALRVFIEKVKVGSRSDDGLGERIKTVIIGVLVGVNLLIFLAIPTLVILPIFSQAEETSASTQVPRASQSSQSQQTLQRSTQAEQAPVGAGSVTGEVDSTKSYEINGSASSRIGIDVSDYQGVIDWQAVAKNGIEFAIVKVGARGYIGGTLIADRQFEANIEGARKAGLQVGVYFFSQSINEAEALEEADYVLAKLNGRALDYPVVYDFESVSDSEGRGNGLSAAQRSANAGVFCERIAAAGYTPMLYGNRHDMAYYDYTLLLDYDLWFAEYDSREPHATYPIDIWQFTSSGVINGIGTRVDLNVHFDTDTPRQLPGNIIIH
ncbi:MAG TPA: hypothetical protein DEB24_01350 [Coriobacteriia bacterium]|nr:hypothetical protein [Coriobacteriia bacterium]